MQNTTALKQLLHNGRPHAVAGRATLLSISVDQVSGAVLDRLYALTARNFEKVFVERYDFDIVSPLVAMYYLVL